MRDISLYFHIPFCKSKCNYCDFTSYSNMENRIEEYIKGVITEIDLYKSIYRVTVDSILFGGGTPSLVEPSYISNILGKCREKFIFSNNIEITIECNPESLTKEKLQMYKEIGINRISIGMQAWQNNLLDKLGRVHSTEQFVDAFMNARDTGFNNINIDLMFGLPNQTMDNWDETLKNIINLNPEHISCYSLSIEEGTRFYNDYINNMLYLPNEDVNRDMYNRAKELFMQSKYIQYEISNFSKKGYECTHNLVYWTFKEYIGFGVAAHSFYNNYRTANFSNINSYLEHINRNELAYEVKDEVLPKDKISEYIITRLRLIKGINKSEFRNKFGIDIESLYSKNIKEYIKEDLIYDDVNIVRLTDRGIDVSNSILCEFV